MVEGFNKHIYRILLGFTLILVGLGTTVYHLVEKFSWLDSYYFSVVTLATVGYGDYAPRTNFGKLFTTFYIFVGVGIITTFFSYRLKRRAEQHHERLSARAKKHQDRKQ